MNIWQRMGSLSRSKKVYTVLGIAALLLAIPVTLTLVQSQQDIRQEAATITTRCTGFQLLFGCPTPTSAITPTTAPVTTTVTATPSGTLTPAPVVTGSANTYVMPSITFLAGDANNDKEINILDYSIMISCFNDEPSCSDPLFFGSDLNDDSYVNVIDLNLYLRELARHLSS